MVKYNDAVEKPQLRFKDFVDNSEAPFVPRLKVKHNAMVEWNVSGRFSVSPLSRRQRIGSPRKPLSLRNRPFACGFVFTSRPGLPRLGVTRPCHHREAASRERNPADLSGNGGIDARVGEFAEAGAGHRGGFGASQLPKLSRIHLFDPGRPAQSDAMRCRFRRARRTTWWTCSRFASSCGS